MTTTTRRRDVTDAEGPYLELNTDELVFLNYDLVDVLVDHGPELGLSDEPARAQSVADELTGWLHRKMLGPAIKAPNVMARYRKVLRIHQAQYGGPDGVRRRAARGELGAGDVETITTAAGSALGLIVALVALRMGYPVAAAAAAIAGNLRDDGYVECEVLELRRPGGGALVDLAAVA